MTDRRIGRDEGSSFVREGCERTGSRIVGVERRRHDERGHAAVYPRDPSNEREVGAAVGMDSGRRILLLPGASGLPHAGVRVRVGRAGHRGRARSGEGQAAVIGGPEARARRAGREGSLEHGLRSFT